MLKLKLQYFGHLMWRVDSLKKTLMLGGIGAGGEGDDRGWDGWMASLTQWTWVGVNSGSWWWTGRPGVLQFMGLQRHGVGHDWATELTDSHIHTWLLEKNKALTRWKFVSKVMSLLYNMLSRFVITFLPRSKHLLISWLQSPSVVILEPKKIKSPAVSIGFPSIFHEVMGPDVMIVEFLIFFIFF